MVEIQQRDPDTFEVTVNDMSTTTHTVTVGDDVHQALTGGQATKAELVQRSFEFLLERESNTSILRSFDLPVIGRYFPEYERTIKAWAKEG